MVLNFALKVSELRNSVRFAEKRSQIIVKLKERRHVVGRIDLMKKGLRLSIWMVIFVRLAIVGRIDLMKKGLRRIYRLLKICNWEVGRIDLMKKGLRLRFSLISCAICFVVCWKD